MPVPIDEAKFVQAQVASATPAKIAPTLLKNWSDRGVISPDQKAAGPGTRALYSLRSVLKIATMAELVKMGVTPIRAANAASEWTDFGHGPLPGTPKRDPCEIFPDGWTILCVFQSGEAVVKHMPHRGTDPLLLFYNPHTGMEFGVAAVHLNKVDYFVRATLTRGE